jgi:hypothetical protein
MITGPLLGSLLLASSLVSTHAAAIFDDFTAGAAAGWSEYLFPAGQSGSFDVVGGVYILEAAPSSSSLPAVIGAMRPESVWSDYEIGADFSGWYPGHGADNPTNSVIGILANVTANQNGTLDGIMLFVVPEVTATTTSAFFAINVISNNVATSIIADVNIDEDAMDPARWYRMVFRREGANLTGELYALPERTTPMARLTASLPGLSNGMFGLIAADRSAVYGGPHHGVRAEWDNVYATDGVAQPDLQIDPAVILTWPVWTAGFVLESAGTAEGPWHPVNVAPELTPEGNTVSVKTDTETRYFRLVRP